MFELRYDWQKVSNWEPFDPLMQGDKGITEWKDTGAKFRFENMRNLKKSVVVGA